MINSFAQKQIDYIRERCKEIKPLVAIHCITFNHESYLKDALEGFVMQKTDFPFVAIVHEDASTDGTAKVLKEYALKYPDIIFAIYEEENQYSKRDGSLREIMNEAIKATGAKYVALCEGDDYWTDPLKLQKQVDFLENNPDYGMVYTKVKRLIQSSHTIKDEWGGKMETFSELLLGNAIPTLTTLIRSEALFNFEYEIKPTSHKWLMGDYPLWLFIAANHKIKFIDNKTGVYRILNESASHSKDIITNLSFRKNFKEIAYFFAGKYNNENLSKIYQDLILREFYIKILSGELISLKEKMELLNRIDKIKPKVLVLSTFFSNKFAKRIIINKFKSS